MTSTPMWLGLQDLNLFGWADWPDHRSPRAMVIMCPPLAGELISAHDTFMELSDGLVERGVAVLRFDYPGTGDSADVPGMDDVVPLWLEAIAAAVRWATDAGAEHVAAVGMRMGATMLAIDQQVLDQLDAVVLWDPCLRGRAFLRQQEVLAKLLSFQLGAPQFTDDDFSLPGYVYSHATAEHLANLSLNEAVGRLPERALVLARDPVMEARLRERFESPGLQVEAVTGQPELLDIATPESVIPKAAIARISGWLDQLLPTAAHAVDLPRSPDEALVDAEVGITERFVRLGPVGLFGIITQPPVPHEGPTVLFLNAAAEHHIGPARQWVELSRRLAGHGFRCARVDLSGLGDSPARSGGERRVIYSPTTLVDVKDALDDLLPDDPTNTVVIGLCSGAYAAMEAGAALGLRGVIAISPILEVAVPTSEDLPGVVTGDLIRPDIATPRPRYAHAILSRPRVKHFLLRTPSSLWRLADTLGIHRAPAEGFRPVVDRVEHTLVLCNAYDSRAYLDRGQWIVDRLTETGRFGLEVVDADHGLLARRGRSQVTDTIVDSLLAWFPPTVAAGR